MRRQLLFVSASPPTELCAELIRRDWELVPAADLHAAADLLRTQAFRVALFDLERLDSVATAQLKLCRSACTVCEWVGILPPGALVDAGGRAMVLAGFHDHHTRPADPVFLCQAVGHAWGRATLRQGAAREIRVPLDRLQAVRLQAEREAIALSLDRCGQNVSVAARQLGISRMTLYRLMAKHSIPLREGS